MTVLAGIFFPLSSVAMAPSGRASTEDTVLAEPERDGEIAQVVLERLDHLDVTELEHPVALLHDGDLGAEGREHGRVLDPDHAGAGDHHRARDRVQVDDPVGVDDGALVELDVAGWAGRVPVAITILSALARRTRPSPPSISTVCGSRKLPVPVITVTRLRVSWLRTTSISRPTTWVVRAARSAMVISSLTR